MKCVGYPAYDNCSECELTNASCHPSQVRREDTTRQRGKGDHANREISPPRSLPSTPNTEDRAKETQRLNSDDVPRASVNPFIIENPDGSETWLCPCHEEPVKWEGNCPSCSVEVG